MVQRMGLDLLVGPLVFLVDYDEAKIGQRCEQRTARAHDHVVLAFADVPPLVELLAWCQPAVHHRHTAGEPGVDPFQRLRCQRYLGNQEDGLAALAHHLVDGSQVDFGFAAARDTVE